MMGRYVRSVSEHRSMVRDDAVAERYEERDVGDVGTEGSRTGAPNERYDEYQRRIAARIANHRRTPRGIVKRLLRTPDAFAVWLRDHPPEAVVGAAVTPDDASLASPYLPRQGTPVNISERPILAQGTSLYMCPLPASE
jgi:hypothetical protein